MSKFRLNFKKHLPEIKQKLLKTRRLVLKRKMDHYITYVSPVLKSFRFVTMLPKGNTETTVKGQVDFRSISCTHLRGYCPLLTQ